MFGRHRRCASRSLQRSIQSLIRLTLVEQIKRYSQRDDDCAEEGVKITVSRTLTDIET